MENNAVIFMLLIIAVIVFAVTVWATCRSTKTGNDVVEKDKPPTPKALVSVSHPAPHSKTTPAPEPDPQWDITNEFVKISIKSKRENYENCTGLTGVNVVFTPVGNSYDLGQWFSHIVEPVMKALGMLLHGLEGTSQTFKKNTEDRFAELVEDNMYLKVEAQGLQSKQEVSLPSQILETVVTHGELFLPRLESVLEMPKDRIWSEMGLELKSLNPVAIDHLSCSVLGVGGVFSVVVGYDYQIAQSKFSFTRYRTNEYIPSAYVNQFIVKELKTTVTNLVEMPSITAEVLEKMKSIPMDNIAPYGEFYRAAGYLAVEARLDNETFVFCSSKGYLVNTSSFEDVRKHTIVDELVRLRAERSPELEKTDYGYVWKKEVAPVHWYV